MKISSWAFLKITSRWLKQNFAHVLSFVGTNGQGVNYNKIQFSLCTNVQWQSISETNPGLYPICTPYFVLSSIISISQYHEDDCRCPGTKLLQAISKHKHMLTWLKLHVTHMVPDSKVHGANMGSIWGRQDPGGPHVGPMNLAIWGITQYICH